MTLDQIEHVLRELGWRGKAGSGPQVFVNSSAMFGRMWIEKGLVVMDGYAGKSWMDPSAVTAITPTGWDERPTPLRAVE